MTDLKGELASLRIDRERPARSPWRWPLFLLLPVLLGLTVLYGLRVRQAMAAVEVETVTAAVSTPTQVSAGTPILTASGYVVARRKAVVSAKIQGRLAELRVEEGSRALKGEVIARLESTDYEAQVQRSHAALQRAEADRAETVRQYRLTESLRKDELMSQDVLDAAQSRVAIADAAVKQAQADLAWTEAQYQNTVIRAPFTGTVVKKMAEVGESVAPIPPGVNISTSSGAIVALADLDTLEVEVDVSESNVARLSADQPAVATVEAFPERSYKAVLRQVIPTADRTKATVQVKVTIVEKDKDLKPEMSAKVTFLEPEAKQPAEGAVAPVSVVTVPSEAVAKRNGKPVVFEVREGKVRQLPVVTGVERQGHVVVREGLAGSEMLVTHVPESLRDGDSVRIKK